jgi:hypothetical protein
MENSSDDQIAYILPSHFEDKRHLEEQNNDKAV